MAIDSQQRSLDPFAFNHMGPYSAQPQFTNPWSSSAAVSSSTQLFPNSLAAPSIKYDGTAKQEPPRMGGVSMSYGTMPMSAPSMSNASMPASYSQADMLPLHHDLLSSQRLSQEPGYASDVSYSSGSSPQLPPQPYTPASTASFESIGYQSPASIYQASQQLQPGADRRLSHPSTSGGYLSAPVDLHRQRQASLNDLSRILGPSQLSRDGFGDAIDASRGMMALSQDVTPRNIYDVQAREQADSYGFPHTHTHSSSSSISSTSPYPSYYSSVDSSMSDYSSMSESVDSVPSRKLPRPHSLLASGVPPAPQSMMGQFNSKVSASTQKKHRCNVCDKRFTRPSSLQTHMYSHTGEKRELS